MNEIDRTPRYVPATVTTLRLRDAEVTGVRAYPAGMHPEKCPLIADCTAVEVVTIAGSRWYGVERAWINSELRMVVAGFNARFEELAAWEKAAVAV